MTLEFLGDCRNEDLVNELFGDVSAFARLIEEKGDNFTDKNLVVKYNGKTDIHSFFLRKI
jgi:hypothetical protein